MNGINHNTEFLNVLMINTTNIIDFSKIGYNSFHIYEIKNIKEPSIYTLEISEMRGYTYDILNHFVYKNTEDLACLYCYFCK